LSSVLERTATAPGGGLLSAVRHWFEAMPHPGVVVEVAEGFVAGAHGGRRGRLVEELAMEPLPEGAVVPSPVEDNIQNAAAVQQAISRVAERLGVRGATVALLLPDQAVRVFLPQFDEFPGRAEEAVPLLRWRLRKSVPFDVEETLVSYAVQPAREKGVEVLAALARQRIVRQYEAAAADAGLVPGVVLGSTLATLPLIEDTRPVLLARMAGRCLSTTITAAERLYVFRSTEMSAEASALEPQALLDEIYPAAAFYQDTWKGSLEQILLAGFAARAEEFRGPLERELGCAVKPLTASAALSSRLTAEARALAERQLHALAGWMRNVNA
jgi:Tfp pilus assembly PilM family ATPase